MNPTVCVICGAKFEADGGYGFCPEHQKKLNEGYVAMVEIDPEKSPKGETLTPATAWRTGNVVWLESKVAGMIFHIMPPAIMYVTPQTALQLQQLGKELN